MRDDGREGARVGKECARHVRACKLHLLIHSFTLPLINHLGACELYHASDSYQPRLMMGSSFSTHMTQLCRRVFSSREKAFNKFPVRENSSALSANFISISLNHFTS